MRDWELCNLERLVYIMVGVKMVDQIADTGEMFVDVVSIIASRRTTTCQS